MNDHDDDMKTSDTTNAAATRSIPSNVSILLASSYLAGALNLERDAFRILSLLDDMRGQHHINAEELRGQVGEVIPGAFMLATRAILGDNGKPADLARLIDAGALSGPGFCALFVDRAIAEYAPSADGSWVVTKMVDDDRSEYIIGGMTMSLTKAEFDGVMKHARSRFKAGQDDGMENMRIGADNSADKIRVANVRRIARLLDMPSAMLDSALEGNHQPGTLVDTWTSRGGNFVPPSAGAGSWIDPNKCTREQLVAFAGSEIAQRGDDYCRSVGTQYPIELGDFMVWSRSDDRLSAYCDGNKDGFAKGSLNRNRKG